jgi:hypothetical protein
MERGTWEDPDSASEEVQAPLFREYAESHIELQVTPRGASLRPSTKALYRKLLRNHLADFFELKLTEIKKPMVDKWFMETSSKGILTTA